jgi:hypothetical protein
MREELGPERWEAIGHFLSDGDYLAFNLRDYRGAVASYQHAWDILDNEWQQRTGGIDILKGIADFSLRSEDPELAAETLELLSPNAALIANAEFSDALRDLTTLADRKP